MKTTREHIRCVSDQPCFGLSGMNRPKTTARDLPPRMLRRVRTLAERIRRFQFRDIRPKAASELPVEHASRLLWHSEKEITERVYRRLGEVVKPTK